MRDRMLSCVLLIGAVLTVGMTGLSNSPAPWAPGAVVAAIPSPPTPPVEPTPPRTIPRPTGAPPQPMPAEPPLVPGPPAMGPTGGPAAGTVTTIRLDVSQERPAPKPQTPRAAGGTGAIVINGNRTEVGFAITYAGLSGPVASAHVHRGVAGEAGPVAQTICGAPLPALAGRCPAGATGTIAGVWRITSSLASDLLAGRLYINLHTALNPDGEVRGQIVWR